MKAILKFFIFTVFTYNCSEAKNIFIEAKEATQIQEILSKEDLSGAVVVFDVDLVLMVLDVYAFSSCSFKSGLGRRLIDKILKDCNMAENSEEYKNLMCKVLYDTTLVSTIIPGIIKDLQKKGVKVMGHTSRESGQYGEIAHQEDLVIKQLQNLGIDFSEVFDDKEIIVDNIKKKGKTYPLFKKGILFSGGGYSKGEVQKAFHEKIKWIPKRIVFIDDMDKNLHAVEDAMGLINVSVTSIHYTEVECKRCNEDAYKIKRANFQVDQLIKTKKWVKDKEADLLLQ